MKRNLLLAHPWFAVYNTEGGSGEGGAGDGGQGGAGDGGQGGDGKGGTPPPKTFTQDQVNKFLADDRRKHQEQIKKTVTQLEELKGSLGVTEQAKAELEQRIQTLNESLMTEQEKAKNELAKKDKESKTQIDALVKDRDSWKTEYSKEVITNQILKSSSKHDVVSDVQMLDLLSPKTRLVEVLDTDGKTVKGYAPKVKISLPNEKGEEVELDLSVEDTVKRMKELPERYGNLFKSGVKSGMGGSGSTGGGGTDLSAALKNPEAYRKARKSFGFGRQ